MDTPKKINWSENVLGWLSENVLDVQKMFLIARKSSGKVWKRSGKVWKRSENVLGSLKMVLDSLKMTLVSKCAR